MLTTLYLQGYFWIGLRTENYLLVAGAGDGVGPFGRIFNLNFSSPSKHSKVGANCDLDVEPVSYLK